MDIWTEDDRRAGLCSRSHVGQPKGVAPVEQTPAPHSPATASSVIKDALRAYEMKGNVAYLKANPKLLNRMLEQVILEKPPAAVLRLIGLRG